MLTPAMTRLVDGITQPVDALSEPIEIAAAAAEALSVALPAGVGLLTSGQCVPDAQRYCQHVAYVDPRGRFSIVSLVWLPGQATPIHDHACWCVVGVVLGREEETRYDALPGDRLRRQAVCHNDAGSVCWLVPPDSGLPGGIHQVRAVSDGVTISLHIYGDDIGARGSSIRRTYPESRLVAPGTAHRAPDAPADGAAAART